MILEVLVIQIRLGRLPLLVNLERPLLPDYPADLEHLRLPHPILADQNHLGHLDTLLALEHLGRLGRLGGQWRLP